jgi:hypothetical protein
MKIILVRPNGKRLPAKLPYEGADFAVLVTGCPECGAHEPKLQGTGRRPSKDGRAWEADAVALCCDRHVGTLRCEMNTLFGVEEDERVFRMGIKIY